MKQYLKISFSIMKWFFISLFALTVFYIIYFQIENHEYLDKKASTLLGTFVLDLERTDLGIYSDSIDMYRDLTIEFKQDKTFKINKSVPFIVDTAGTWQVGGMDRWSYIYFDCFLEKYGREAPGTPISESYFDKGDSVFYINSITPRIDQQRKSDVHIIYFKKQPIFSK